MSAFFKSISEKVGRLADIINGTEPQETTPASPKQEQEAHSAPKAVHNPKPESKPESKPKPAPKPQPEPETPTDIFNNAIDKRNLAIRYLKDEFREVTGSSSSAIASLYVYVITDREDYDVKKYAWADNSMKEQLRLELDNAMLDGVGRRALEIRLVTMDLLPEQARCVIDGILYYSFLSAPKRQTRVRAKITVVEGTGSLAKQEYNLDSDQKTVYHIGRGPMAAKPGAYRPNDIVVRDNDPDTEIQSRNNHVSSAHADIIASNGRFYIKALKWGCRPLGGACTKLLYDGDEHEIKDASMRHPLNDGYIIELGKNVVLLYNSIDD